MQVSARRVVCLSLLITAFVSVSAPAQIFEMRDYNGKQIGCARSGLIGWYKSCGTDAFYSQIFLGTVQSVKPIKVGEFEEFRLVLQPEEVFQGDVPPHFEVTTSQGECLPEIHAGDRWLFYIYTDKDRGPQLAYGHDSAPIAQVEERLARLRRLATMPDAGIIMGHLSWGWGNQEEADQPDLANKQILLTSADGKQHRAFTNQDGHFEFDPLPVGKYQLTLNKAGLWTDDDGEITVKARHCEDYLIKLAPDGLIAGRVTEADRKPVANLRVKIVLTGEDNQAWAPNNRCAGPVCVSRRTARTLPGRTRRRQRLFRRRRQFDRTVPRSHVERSGNRGNSRQRRAPRRHQHRNPTRHEINDAAAGPPAERPRRVFYSLFPIVP
jgi:hypothetical protein